jgi:1-phosphatidylinositol-4-phosphate 5-kinase
VFVPPGIIDILQQYDLKKRGETVLKSILHKKEDISSVGPELYAKRFLRFLSAHTT